MLRTKQAKKLLSKKEQNHLTAMEIHSIEQFKKTRAIQIAHDKVSEITSCLECNQIARKLGME